MTNSLNGRLNLNKHLSVSCSFAGKKHNFVIFFIFLSPYGCTLLIIEIAIYFILGSHYDLHYTSSLYLFYRPTSMFCFLLLHWEMKKLSFAGNWWSTCHAKLMHMPCKNVEIPYTLSFMLVSPNWKYCHQ